MDNFKIFKNNEFGSIRTIETNGETYFVGKDIAEALGYDNTSKAIIVHVDEEDKNILKSQNGTLENVPNRGLQIINESGLYSLILSSKLSTAKKFKRWVTKDVLPNIRKHGAYAADELLNNPDFAIATFKALKEEKEKRQELEALQKIQAPKAIFADAVSASSTSILVGELAKILRQNGVDLGQNRLFLWLRQNGYLINRKGSDWNMPTQYSMERELFKIKETAIIHADGHVSVSKTAKITGKGQAYFINKFLPIEQEK